MSMEQGNEQPTMRFLEGMSPNERMDELVQYNNSSGGEVAIDQLANEACVQNQLSHVEFVATIERAMAFGRVGARDFLSVVYTAVSLEQ